MTRITLYSPPQIETLPDLNTPFQAMKLMDSVRKAALTQEPSLIRMAILDAKCGDVMTLRNLKGCIEDNEAMVARVIGAGLVQEVKKFGI